MDVKTVIINLLVATYTICLPLIIKLITDLKKDKENGHIEMQTALNDIKEEMNRQAKQLHKMQQKLDFDEAMTSRYRIIRASDEITNGADLSDEHIEQLGEDTEIYKSYCALHPEYKNHKGQRSMQTVLEYEDKLLNKKKDGEKEDV